MPDAAPHVTEALQPAAGEEHAPPSAEWHTGQTGTGERLVLAGDWTVHHLADLWRLLPKQVHERRPPRLTLDAAGVTRCDTSGIALMLEVRRLAQVAGGEVRFIGLRSEYTQLMELFQKSCEEEVRPAPHRHRSVIEQMGAATVRMWQDAFRQIAFIGELFATLLTAVVKPRSIRWSETSIVFEKAGVDALPLVCVISFLMGLIMAFQSALPMRDFGADIFVANLVVIAMFRELGVLMTAVVMAGRSGSAFAAEIGTMKVNEELDALSTMGLNPMRFLVLPRVVAGLMVMPLLTVFANVSGCIGGFLVMMSLGHTPSAIWQQVLSISPMRDLTAGMIKSFVFGLTVAAIGCQRGLETGKGPTAVGDSTTSAVVSGIFYVVILDAMFSILFHYLRI